MVEPAAAQEELTKPANPNLVETAVTSKDRTQPPLPDPQVGIEPSSKASAKTTAAAPVPNSVPMRSLFRFGLGGWLFLFSIVWIGAGIFYLDNAVSLRNVPYMQPNELGMFIAGVVTPVLLFWIALAYLRHSTALSVQLRQMRLSADTMREQSKAMRLTERHMRTDTFLTLTRVYLEEMAKHAAILAAHTYDLSAEAQAALWQRYAQGDQEVFFRCFFEEPKAKLANRLASAIAEFQIASKSAHMFCGYYQVFILQASDIDDGNLMIEAYKGGYLGDLNRAVSQVIYDGKNPFS